MLEQKQSKWRTYFQPL